MEKTDYFIFFLYLCSHKNPNMGFVIAKTIIDGTQDRFCNHMG